MPPPPGQTRCGLQIPPVSPCRCQRQIRSDKVTPSKVTMEAMGPEGLLLKEMAVGA